MMTKMFLKWTMTFYFQAKSAPLCKMLKQYIFLFSNVICLVLTYGI